MPPGHADRLEYLQVRDGGGHIPGDRLADQEQRGGQGRDREGQQAGSLVPGDPVDRVAEGDGVVPHVDVGRPVTRARSARNRGIAAAPAGQPHQRVDEDLVGGAQHVGPVLREQGRRGDHAALAARRCP